MYTTSKQTITFGNIGFYASSRVSLLWPGHRSAWLINLSDYLTSGPSLGLFKYSSSNGYYAGH